MAAAISAAAERVQDSEPITSFQNAVFYYLNKSFMKKSKWVLIAALVLVVLWGVGVYNNMVVKEEGVSKAWGDVESMYQRRADLIPNLVNTVKGYASHESETLQAVVDARAKASQISIDASNMTAEQLKEFQAAQKEIGGALSRLIAISEAYPDLKANQNFLELQSQLEGTENRIAVERRNFNEAVNNLNSYSRRFPQKLIAMLFGFEDKPYFESEEGSNVAPVVEF